MSRMTPDDSAYKPILQTRIFAALRMLSSADLSRIRINGKKQVPVNRDVYHLLKILETNKNLLAFFPYNFYFEDPHDFEKGLGIILKAIESDFRHALQYRFNLRPDKDTFLCFLYQRQMILTEWKSDTLQLVETFPIKTSPLFMQLLRYTDDAFSGGSLK